MRQGEEGARSEAKSNDRFDSWKEIKGENTDGHRQCQRRAIIGLIAGRKSKERIRTGTDSANGEQ